MRARPELVLACVSAGLVLLFPGSLSYPGQSLANLIASLRYAADVRPIAEVATLADGALGRERALRPARERERARGVCRPDVPRVRVRGPLLAGRDPRQREHAQRARRARREFRRADRIHPAARARAAEFAIGARPDVRVAQTDLPATVLDLLGLGGGPGSFAPTLRGASAAGHEECHVMVQPYGDPSLVVARRTHKHTYRLASGRLTRQTPSAELDEGPAEPIADDLPYARFVAEYGCRRHRESPDPAG